MKTWLFIFGLSIFLFLMGRYLQRLHGFDPPYIIFTIGFWIEILAVVIGVVAVLMVLFRMARKN